MSRPAPTVLIKQRIGQTHRECLILQAAGHWTVVYAGQPINILNQYLYTDDKKYIKNGFANEGHARNLARKLNHQFNTDLFQARKVL